MRIKRVSNGVHGVNESEFRDRRPDLLFPSLFGVGVSVCTQSFLDSYRFPPRPLFRRFKRQMGSRLLVFDPQEATR